MAVEIKKEIALEIAHVLFLDVVGYSKLLVDEQRAVIDELNSVVRETDEYREAESAGRLIKIPTGDGMALVFYSSPEAPVECALEISRGLKEHPKLRVRMGVHSGPVSGVIDVNERANVAGAGINFAQRVMDCGDGGHILLSKRVAEDLEQYGHWRPHLHDLGQCEVKHGVRLSLVNLYTEELGNPAMPEKVKLARAAAAKERQRAVRRGVSVGMLALVVGALVIGFVVFRNKGTSLTDSAASAGKSIAVLPFTNMSPDPANAFFADGVQDEILTHLAKIADLKVISRTSVLPYRDSATRNIREIGKQLGVAHLLEGSVQRAGNHVRVEAQLINALTDTHQWAEHYDRDLADVFAVQSEIAKTIADQLKVKLSAAEKLEIEKTPTKDLGANDLYVRAKVLLDSASLGTGRGDDVVKAVDLLDQAVAQDPSFVRAFCALAEAHGRIYQNIDHTPARLALVDAAIRNALRLAPDSGDAHFAQADNFYLHREYDRARAELALAQRVLPNDSRIPAVAGYIDRRQGRHEEGVRNLQRALELDPRNYFTIEQLAFSYRLLHQYSEQAAAFDRALAIRPNDLATRANRAVVDLEWRADTRPLHAVMESIPAENPEAAAKVAGTWFDLAMCERDASAARQALANLGNSTFGDNAVRFSAAFGEGLLARMIHDEAKAHAAFAIAREQQEKVVAEQPSYGPALSVLGVIDAGLGRKEEALSEGRRAVELMPSSKDAINGPLLLESLAVIAAWTGEKELAIWQLTLAARVPTAVSYGYLKLHPFWDPLRGDPQFEKIVTSLAPKD